MSVQAQRPPPSNLPSRPEPHTSQEANGVYVLPPSRSVDESKRLDLQHEILRLTIGGLYKNKDAVREILAPREGVQQSILDLGSGSGAWAVGMALEFPHVNVVAIDLTPHIPQNVPSNCRFETGDFHKGFSHLQDKFDVVHGRALGAGISDYKRLLEIMGNYLRPGGVLLLMDGHIGIWNKDKAAFLPSFEPQELEGPETPPSPSQTHCWYSRLIGNVTQTLLKSQRLDALAHPLRIPVWMAETGLFDDIQSEAVYTPIGWEGLPGELEHGKEVGELMLGNTQQYVNILLRVLLSHGKSEALVEKLRARVHDEFEGPKIQSYIRWNYAWATRRT